MTQSTPDHRLAIVTGGATGLGLACSRQLLEDGFHVLSLGVDAEEEIDHPAYTHRRFDVTDADAIAALARETPQLDALVNAAGIIQHEGREFTQDGFDKVMAVNLGGTQRLCFALKEALAARGGAVVNFASMWSVFGSPRNPAYSASKGAVLQLTRALAHGWGGQVRVNAVAPGWIRTRMSQAAMNDPERAGPILKRIPAGDWGEPADVAAAVSFLVSPAARYITGVMLPVDGGYSIA